MSDPSRRTITWQQLQKGEIKEVSYGSVVYQVPDIGLVWVTDGHIGEVTQHDGATRLVLTASKVCGPQDGPPGWFCIAVEEIEKKDEP